MKKIIGAVIIAMLFMGAGCEKTKYRTTTEYVPVEPSQPVEPVEPEVTVPTAGIGSIKADMDCEGGTITTNYSFGNVSDDSKDFLIQYQRNGVVEDLTYPSTSTTGSRTIVKDIYYASHNDDKRPAYWVVTVSYQSANESYDLVSTTVKQPACDEDNNTAVVTTYQVK